MRESHCNPEEAVQIFQDLGAVQAIGVHWGTSRLTLKPLAEPPQRLRAALQEAGIPVDRFRALTHCERWDFVMSASCRNMQAVAAIYHRRIIRFGLLLAPL